MKIDFHCSIKSSAVCFGVLMLTSMLYTKSNGQVSTNKCVPSSDAEVVSLVSTEWDWEAAETILKLRDLSNARRVQELDDLLFGDTHLKRIREMNPTSPERVILGLHAMLRRWAALEAANDSTDVFDGLLVRYYYGNEENIQKLSDSEQMLEVAKRLVTPTEAYLTALAKERNLTNTQHQVTVDFTVVSKRQEHAVLHVFAESGRFYRHDWIMEVKRKSLNGKWLWIPISNKPWTLGYGRPSGR